MRCPECGWPKAERPNQTCWRQNINEPCRRDSTIEDVPTNAGIKPEAESGPVGWRKYNHAHLFLKRDVR